MLPSYHPYAHPLRGPGAPRPHHTTVRPPNYLSVCLSVRLRLTPAAAASNRHIQPPPQPPAARPSVPCDAHTVCPQVRGDLLVRNESGTARDMMAENSERIEARR